MRSSRCLGTALYRSAGWWGATRPGLFGILFIVDHPDLRRILTDYGFEGPFPLAQEFPLTALSN